VIGEHGRELDDGILVDRMQPRVKGRGQSSASLRSQYKETIKRAVKGEFAHKKKTTAVPASSRRCSSTSSRFTGEGRCDNTEFENKIKGWPASQTEKSFRGRGGGTRAKQDAICRSTALLAGYPLVNLKVTLLEGDAYHGTSDFVEMGGRFKHSRFAGGNEKRLPSSTAV